MTTQPGRRRDAAATRQALLDAARGRFAKQGYAHTTVREIAEDAGVNVALINRYFESKEGLFAACLRTAVDELGRTVTENTTLEQMPRKTARQLAAANIEKKPGQLALLLRSSGDERADQIRVDTLRSFAERLAEVAGDDSLLLRAQIVLCAALGIAMLRSTVRLEPLASATEDDLVGPLSDLFDGLLSRAS